jgi:hypothetical protein
MAILHLAVSSGAKTESNPGTVKNFGVKIKIEIGVEIEIGQDLDAAKIRLASLHPV